jgi:glycosyltransferase involved in cell wall biosynthesis
VDFRVSVIGESFREAPAVFDRARERWADRIDRWGYQQKRADYEAALREADVIVSTADHEFFGIGVVEAVAAGAYPLVPNRLAYPEVLSADDSGNQAALFYEGGPDELADRLAVLSERFRSDDLWPGDPQGGVRAVRGFTWAERVPRLDGALEGL